MSLHIQLLGHVLLTFENKPLSKLRTARQQGLLAYLLLHRQTPQQRQRMAADFWPESSDAQARTNLRNLSFRLQKGLPSDVDWFFTSQHTLHWNNAAPYRFDVAEFEAAATMAQTTAELQTAVSLYTGSLLPGWTDEWLLPLREQLQQRYLATLDKLIKKLETQRAYETAVHYAEHLLQEDPLRESSYRDLIRLLALNGNRAGALAVYERCRTVLWDELGVIPALPTRTLHTQLLQAEAETDTTLTNRPLPLVGREVAWERLLQTWQTAVAGQPHLVVISGVPGIGKTRLAEELLFWGQQQGIATARAHTYATAGGLAYSPLTDWLHTPALKKAWSLLDARQLTELARLLPEILGERRDLPAPAPLAESWQRQRFFETLAQGLGKRPLILLLDDLQWCDVETLAWLQYLWQHFRPPARLLLVATLRSDELADDHVANRLIRRLYRTHQVTEIRLAPLSQAETAVLVSQVLDQKIDQETTVRLYQETEGNPLFAVETARANQQLGDGNQSLSNLQTLPPTIHAVIKSRLVQLSKAAQELANAAAVIGRAFSYDVLATIARLSDEALVDGLEELLERQIIGEQTAVHEELYRFSHDKLREVAYADLSRVRQRRLHQAVAAALEQHHAANLEAHSSQIAPHYEKAGAYQAAIPHYQRAAQVAQGLYANQDAIHYTQRGLALLEKLTDVEVEWRRVAALDLYERLGDLLNFVGQGTEARTAYGTALQFVNQDPVQSSHLYRKQGVSHIPESNYEAALTAYDRADAFLTGEPTEPRHRWWQAWIQNQGERFNVYYWRNQGELMEGLQERVRPVLEQYGTPQQRVHFYGNLSIRLRRERFMLSETSVAYAREHLRAQKELGNDGAIPAVTFQYGFILLWHGNFVEAERMIREGLALAQQIGDLNLQSRCWTYLTIALRKQNKVEAVQDSCQQALVIARKAKMIEYLGTVHANLAWVAWKRGDVARVGENGRLADQYWQQRPEGHASCAFQWTALFPQLAVEKEIERAVGYVQQLLDPAQQALPEVLTAVLQQIVAAREQNEPAAKQIQQSLELAQSLAYL